MFTEPFVNGGLLDKRLFHNYLPTAICVIFVKGKANAQRMQVISYANDELYTLSGLRFFGPLPASGSTGPCSGPSTLINVVGKRNLNGSYVYLR